MRQYKKYLRRLRNFDIAIILGLVMSIPLNVLLHLHGSDNFDLEEMLDGSLFNAISDRDIFPEALFDFACLCTAVSAFRYTGRALDIGTDEKTLLHPLVTDVPGEISELRGKKHRNRATVLGVFLALMLSIALAVILALTGAWSFALFLTFIVGSLVLLSGCSGLFSRLGQVVDRAAQHKTLNRNYELSIIISAVLSIIPMVFMIVHAIATSATLLTPLGIFTLACTCLVLMSNMTSGSHYLGLSLDFLTNDKSLFFWLNKKETKNNSHWIDRCNNEKLATTVGIVIGIALGITLLSLGICMPAFLAGLPLLLKAPLVIMLTMNMCTSLAANIGRVIDRLLTSKTHQPKTLLHVLLGRHPKLQENLLSEKKTEQQEEIKLNLKPRRHSVTLHSSQINHKYVAVPEQEEKAKPKLTDNTAYQNNSLWKFKNKQPINAKIQSFFEPLPTPILVSN